MRQGKRPGGLAGFGTAAYGGPGWQPRTASHREEIGPLWAPCGIENEWSQLEAVLLHRPGPEILASEDPEAAQMLAPLDLARAQDEHDGLAEAYRRNGVEVHLLMPEGAPRPNQMFQADLFVMTPEGAILARPASAVRAGEERQVARRLADLGIPILRTLRGGATFEGADALWLDRGTVLLGRGLRTNDEAVRQIGATLAELEVEVIPVDLPFGTMHLMGMLRIVDRDLAIAWPRRTPHAAVEALRRRGTEVAFLPAEDEASLGRAFNFVTLAPKRILMPAGNAASQKFYESLEIACLSMPTEELAKAAGAIGCLTGILRRASP